jgi:hypothetical protein
MRKSNIFRQGHTPEKFRHLYLCIGNDRASSKTYKAKFSVHSILSLKNYEANTDRDYNKFFEKHIFHSKSVFGHFLRSSSYNIFE